eukprot:scaffold84885_cov30-Tisochrysis_lutea.AAC.3
MANQPASLSSSAVMVALPLCTYHFSVTLPRARLPVSAPDGAGGARRITGSSPSLSFTTPVCMG